MRTLHRGLLVALIQILIVSSLGGMLLIDRARHPRVWVKTAPVDPDSPFRGRYVQLSLVVEGRGLSAGDPGYRTASLEIDDGRLVAVPAEYGRQSVRVLTGGDGTVRLFEPVAYFIPEHVADPSIRPDGEELWVEVTIPPKGPPRPIRLGAREADWTGEPRPLLLH